jgi:hypothetical protein
MRNVTIPALLISLLACTAHKLEVRLNGQPTQSMEARVAKEDGDRMVDLLLPGGAWSVSASEAGITPRIMMIDGRQHVRIEMPPGRMISSRPIEISLQGLDSKGKPAGTPYTVTLDYNSKYQKASRYS